MKGGRLINRSHGKEILTHRHLIRISFGDWHRTAIHRPINQHVICYWQSSLIPLQRAPQLTIPSISNTISSRNERNSSGSRIGLGLTFTGPFLCGSAEWTDDVVNDRIPQNRQTSLSSFSSSISLSLPSFQSITLINRSNYYTTTYWSQ